MDLSDYQNILVAVDFSVASESAAKRVGSFAKRFRARLTILLTSL
ncbi:universal stress protein [Pseudomonadota bacterium]